MAETGDPFSPAPPQDLDAEESVLGAMMLTPAAVDGASEELRGQEFYRRSHTQIFAVMMELHSEGHPVDAITVSNKLDEQGILAAVGGKQRIHQLAALVPAASNVRHYARIVKEMATLRGLAIGGTEINKLAMERAAPTPELVDRAEQIVFDIAQERSQQDFVELGDTLADTFRQIEEQYEKGGIFTGTASGYRALDGHISGFQPHNLIVIGARPSMGKSALGLGIAANVAVRHRRPVALFTLEMSRWEVTQRFLSSTAHIDSIRLREGKLQPEEWDRLYAAHNELKTAPLLIDDSSTLTIMELRSKARRAKLKYPNLALVLVDYLQLMESGQRTENRVQEVSKISRGLKVLAGEIATPVVAMSQLSRQCEQRHDKRPMLSDLRESGSVEQDADLVLFLYRDDYYNPEEAEKDGTSGIAEINIAKHRNGPTGKVNLTFVKRFASFSDIAQTK